MHFDLLHMFAILIPVHAYRVQGNKLHPPFAGFLGFFENITDGIKFPSTLTLGIAF